MKRAGIGLTTVLGLVFFAAPALAANEYVVSSEPVRPGDGYRITFVALSGQQNELLIEADFPRRIAAFGNEASFINLTSRCRVPSDSPEMDELSCETEGLRRVSVNMGDMNDYVDIEEAADDLPGIDFGDLSDVKAEGGPGNDLIVTSTDKGPLAGDRLILGGAGDDRIRLQGRGTARGQSGNDTIRGRVGPQRLFGGRGADVLSGGSLTDYCRGGPGLDKIKPSCEVIANS